MTTTTRISGLADLGIVSDVPAFGIPDNAFSAGQNVRAFHGRVTNFPGYAVYATPPIEPYGLFAAQDPDRTPFFVEAGLTKVYVYDGQTHSNITRQTGAVDVDYTMNEYFDRWTGGVQGTLGFLCNGADSPQQWDSINPAVKLKDMVYDAETGQTWGDLSYKAHAMRSFRGVIVALAPTRGATSLPSTVQWCNPLEPGGVLPDFVPRVSNFARERTLGETAGPIIDGARLRGDFIVYKDDATYRMSFIGGNEVFRFVLLPEHRKIINRGCIGVINEGHVIAGSDDVYLFDGNIFRSLLDHRRRTFYNTEIDPERGFNTFVVVNDTDKEVWICFTSKGDGTSLKSPDRAIVWNYHDNTLSDTDLPQVRAMTYGYAPATIPDTFDSPPDITFDDDLKPFDRAPFQANVAYLVGAYGTNLAAFGEVADAAGTPKFCQLERTGLLLNDPKTGIPSSQRVQRTKEMRIHLDATRPLSVAVGAQMAPSGPVVWEPAQDFDPSLVHEARFRATGRYFAYKVLSEANTDWALTSVEFDHTVVRNR